MNLNISSEQQLLVEAFSKLFAAESSPARVRAAEPLGHDPALWRLLMQIGAPVMRVPESMEGGGNSLSDAILVAEQAGKYLASAPLLDVMVSARLLSSIRHPEASAWLDRVQQGAVVTLALLPAEASPSQIVPGGAVADAVLVLERESVVLHERRQGGRGVSPPSHGSTPIGEWNFKSTGGTPLATGATAVASWQAAREELKLLSASCLAGLAREALDAAAAYARDRMAFGRPIGSFQGLAHPLADAVTDVDGAMLLARKTAWAVSCGKPDAAAMIPMAFWWAARSAGRATLLAMRVFGGYGMTLDYNAQLYFRRARALSLTGGDPRVVLTEAGDRLWGKGRPPALPESTISGPDFGDGDGAEAYIRETREFLSRHFGDDMRRFCHESTDMYHPQFQQALGAERLLFPHWPAQYGGRGATRYEAAAVSRTLGEVGFTSAVMATNNIVGLVLMACASEEIKREIVPRLASGEINCSLGYTEPSGGSDLFAARTRAIRDGDDWIIDGQKMFTTQGHLAKYCLLLARTAPERAKHEGLTLFIAPINQSDQSGYEAHRVDTVGNERTNITHYSGLRVPDRYRVGEINGAVKVMTLALTLEQSGGVTYESAIGRLVSQALAWANETRNGVRPIDSAAIRTRLATVQTMFEVFKCLSGRSLWGGMEGGKSKAFGPMAKLFGSETWLKCSADLMDLTAPHSLFRGDTPLGRLELESRRAIPGTIYGGTSEVQRSIVAESALGLPRSRT
ncbi:MAG TPA: acyl-CoA dehydrogenase [Burkholderiales bacterium]|nr:acyl-CoA dehydrogenase [Burkholderiales bacterium]